MELCNYLIENEPQSPMGWHGLGLYFLFLAKRKEELMFRNVSYKRAIDYLMKALTIKPSNRELLLDIALFYALTWDYEQSMCILRGIYPYCEKDPILKEQLALVGGLSLVNKYKKEAVSAYIKKDYMEMIKKFKKILFDIGVSDPIVYNWLIKMSDTKSIPIHEKIKLAVKWQQTDPANPWPYYHLGDFCVLENDPVNASRFYEKSLELFRQVHHDQIFIKTARIKTHYTKSVMQWLNLQFAEALKNINISIRDAGGLMPKETITNYENVRFGIRIAWKIIHLSKADDFLDLYNQVSLINKLFSNLLNKEIKISNSAWLQLHFTATLQSILQPLLIRSYRLKRLLPTVCQFKVKGKVYKEWVSYSPSDAKIDAPLYTLNSIRREYIGIGDEKGILWVNALEKFIMAVRKYRSVEEITEEMQKKLIASLFPSFELISKEALILEEVKHLRNEIGEIAVIKKELPERVAAEVSAKVAESMKVQSHVIQKTLDKIPEVFIEGLKETIRDIGVPKAAKIQEIVFLPEMVMANNQPVLKKSACRYFLENLVLKERIHYLEGFVIFRERGVRFNPHDYLNDPLQRFKNCRADLVFEISNKLGKEEFEKSWPILIPNETEDGYFKYKRNEKKPFNTNIDEAKRIYVEANVSFEKCQYNDAVGKLYGPDGVIAKYSNYLDANKLLAKCYINIGLQNIEGEKIREVVRFLERRHSWYKDAISFMSEYLNRDAKTLVGNENRIFARVKEQRDEIGDILAKLKQVPIPETEDDRKWQMFDEIQDIIEKHRQDVDSKNINIEVSDLSKPHNKIMHELIPQSIIDKIKIFNGMKENASAEEKIEIEKKENEILIKGINAAIIVLKRQRYYRADFTTWQDLADCIRYEGEKSLNSLNPPEKGKITVRRYFRKFLEIAKKEKIELTENLEPKWITFEELREILKKHGIGKRISSVIIEYILSGAGKISPSFEETGKEKKIM